jgi:hypothetical protein
MFNRAQRRSAHAQADFALQHIRYQGHIAEVRQKPRPRFVVRMADQVTGLHGLAGQFTTAGHSLSLAFLRPIDSHPVTPKRPQAESFIAQDGTKRLLG